MKIKRIIKQHRRDMTVDYECEHCGYISENKYAYDDSYFHNTVIPGMKCEKCGKIAGDDYRPLTTKYPDGVQI